LTNLGKTSFSSTERIYLTNYLFEIHKVFVCKCQITQISGGFSYYFKYLTLFSLKLHEWMDGWIIRE
jgi:hypothetical protein